MMMVQQCIVLDSIFVSIFWLYFTDGSQKGDQTSSESALNKEIIEKAITEYEAHIETLMALLGMFLHIQVLHGLC